VLAIDQVADEKTDKPSVVKAVTLEVNVTDGQRIALAGTVGTLSLLLRKAGELSAGDARRVTTGDLGKPSEPTSNARFITVGVIRPNKNERTEYTVPVERTDAHAAELSQPSSARD
jgi:pilus assembly protein CpaB